MSKSSISQKGRIFYVSSDLFIPNSKIEFIKGSKTLTQKEIPFYQVGFYTSLADRLKKEIRIEDGIRVIEFYVIKDHNENFNERRVELRYKTEASQIVDSLIVNGFLK